MIDVSLWDDDEIEIFKLFHFRCANPHCGMEAATLHEIVPKSQLTNTKWNFSMNRIPLCALCHQRVHIESSKEWRSTLKKWRTSRA